MSKKLLLQLHVHSNRSHDSTTSISDCVSYLHNLTLDFDCAVLGITDHNVMPISMKCALRYSTKRVIVIPGIQWRVHQTIFDRLAKRSTRRELITLGNHDDLRCYLTDHTQYSIADNEEIMGHLKEQELLGYVAHNPDLILVVPHPKHFIVDFYGPMEIRDLKRKMDSCSIDIPFFVEVQTGCDPFPRIFSAYESEYCVIGGSDAHEIKGLFGIESLLSVNTTMSVEDTLLDSWDKTFDNCSVASFEELVKDILYILEKNNKSIKIKKNYGYSAAQLLGSVPRWIRRRFDGFPRNLFK